MLRAEVVTDATLGSRADKRVRVGFGELKVACGVHVILQTVPLVGECAIAIYDPESHVGGVMVSGSPDSETATGRELEGPALDVRLALPVLMESLVRMGAERDRLLFSAAGDSRFLSLLSGEGVQHSSNRRPRRGSRGRHPPILVLDLGGAVANVIDGFEPSELPPKA